MDIAILFEHRGTLIQLPVNPEKFEIKYSSMNDSMEIISLGEINRLRGRKLANITFNSFFPYADWFPAIRTKGGFQSNQFYKDFFLRAIEDTKHPCRLVVTGINVSMLVSIESFDYDHRAGEHEDCYYTLNLKEYREYRVTPLPSEGTALTLNSPTPQSTNRASDDKPVITPQQITIGCSVKLSGRVHATSYGEKPGKTFSNYTGRVNLINKKGTHPYHVTTPDGGWLGWVRAEEVSIS